MKTITKFIYFGFAALALGCFALSPIPNAFGVVPAPDGGYGNLTTAEGTKALLNLTTGVANTGLGWSSLLSVTTGNFNTGVGAATLALNTADSNTATGAAALLLNTSGAENTANGTAALVNNSNGSNNSALGAFALNSNTTGSVNTAVGTLALNDNVGGSFNTAIGGFALQTNTTGNDNTVIGAVSGNATGSDNTAIGFDAGSNVTGNSNVCIGAGVFGVVGESNTIRIGDNLPTGAGQSACYIGGIVGQTIDPATAIAVGVDANNKLGTVASSKRFKDDIRPMDKASQAILALKPVTFHYKSDTKATPQFGLIAEEVAEVNPNLVVRDKDGEIYTVRYDAVNAMLLNEFLKAHRKMQEQEATITQLKKDFGATIAQLTARLDQQASQIQKVSTQLAAASPSQGGLEMGRPAQQMAKNKD